MCAIFLCVLLLYLHILSVCVHMHVGISVCVCVCVITVLRLHSLCRMWRPSCLLTPEWMKQSGESHWELQFSLGSMTDPSLSTFTHTSWGTNGWYDGYDDIWKSNTLLFLKLTYNYSEGKPMNSLPPVWSFSLQLYTYQKWEHSLSSKTESTGDQGNTFYIKSCFYFQIFNSLSSCKACSHHSVVLWQKPLRGGVMGAWMWFCTTFICTKENTLDHKHK